MQAALNPGSLLLGITHVQVQKPGCAPHFISPASSSASRPLSRYPGSLHIAAAPERRLPRCVNTACGLGYVTPGASPAQRDRQISHRQKDF